MLRNQRRANPFQLPQVQQVVGRVESPHVLEALLAALGVDPNSSQVG